MKVADFVCLFFFFISYFRGLLAKTQRESFKESRAKCSGPKILLCNVNTDLLIYFKDQDVFQRFHDLKCLCL